RVPTLGHADIDVDGLALRPGRTHTVETQRRVLRSYLAGKTVMDIARELGLPWTAALAIVRRSGVRTRWRRVWATAPAQTSPEFWRWVGYFMAEGYAYEASGSYRVSLANTDPEVRADYIALNQALFGVTPRTRDNEIYFDALN